MKKLFLLMPIIGISILSCKRMSDSERQEIKQQIIELKAQLAGEQAKLENIESFHVLRTANEKAQQVSDETVVIENLKSKIDELEKKLQ